MHHWTQEPCQTGLAGYKFNIFNALSKMERFWPIYGNSKARRECLNSNHLPGGNSNTPIFYAFLPRQ
jgi:hypothetical protein